jgi:ParB-like nuclease domain
VNIEIWPLSRIVEYDRNPRKNDSAVDRMCASIREFGFKIPCLVRSDGELVDGHLRLKAVRSLGVREIPVILCDEWTAVQVKAFRVLVNFDLSLTGFDGGEIEGLLATDDPAVTRRRAKPGGRLKARPHGAEKAGSRLGDLWLCGAHRVLCGGAGADWSQAFALMPGLGAAYVWHDSRVTREVLDGLLRVGFEQYEQVICAAPGKARRQAKSQTPHYRVHVREENTMWASEDKMRRPIVNHLRRATLERGREVIDGAA